MSSVSSYLHSFTTHSQLNRAGLEVCQSSSLSSLPYSVGESLVHRYIENTMKRILVFLTLFLSSSVYADPADAVVRIRIPMGRTSSCGSGTVIQVGDKHSLILTAAHLWSDERENPDPYAYNRKIILDAPTPTRQAESKVGVRLCGLDYGADLALVEVNAVLPYQCKVAPPNTHSMRLLSVGYDRMCGFPGVRVPATSAGTHDGWTWTREIPQEGRSGGGLIDTDTGLLVGVCHGYAGDARGQSGMYVPLGTIWPFLERFAGVPTNRVSPTPPMQRSSPAINPPLVQRPDPFAIPNMVQPYGVGACPPGG